jgi:predicted small metal-binding protein
MPEQFQCPECAFTARAEEYDEVIEQGKHHLDSEHGEAADEGDVEEHVASVSGA